jgi:tripartite-type tricarboxylate transporter receptor subunit TctC
LTNAEMTYVPYPGAAPQINALLGQHITSGIVSFPNVSEQLASGTLRALAALSSTRIGQLPDVPTLGQAGYEDYEADTWFGVIAPTKTPECTLAQLAGWFSAALEADDVRAKLIALGLTTIQNVH